MRKKLLLAIVLVAMVAPLSLTIAEDGDKKFEVTGGLRIRYDRFENYLGENIDDGRDMFSLWPYRARIGVTGNVADNIQVVLEVQNFGSMGDQSPERSYATMSSGCYGGYYVSSGCAPDPNFAGSSYNTTELYQGYVKLDKIGGTDFNVTFGRQEYSFGDGLILGNEEFYNGTVFDGLKGGWNNENWNLAGFYFQTAERNDQSSYDSLFPYWDHSYDQYLIGFVADYTFAGPLKHTLEGYVIYGRDGAVYEPLLEEYARAQLNTYGVRWWRSVNTKEDAEALGLDWSIELAMQSGEARASVGTADLSGSIMTASVGWTLASDNMLHHFHGGYISQSGDSDQTDTDIEGWVPLFPRTHGRFGNSDFFGQDFGGTESGITAWDLGYGLNIGDGKHMIAFDYWNFTPTEDNLKVLDLSDEPYDLKIDDFGSEIDLSYEYMYGKHTWLNFAVAYLDPGDGILQEELWTPDAKYGDSGYPASDKITRVYGGVRLQF